MDLIDEYVRAIARSTAAIGEAIIVSLLNGNKHLNTSYGLYLYKVKGGIETR